MIIMVNADSSICLDAPDDFGNFKILARRSPDTDWLARALDGLATLETPVQAWVDAQALQQRLRPAATTAWREAYFGMITQARKYGWIRDEPIRIGAHIEWRD